MKSTNFCTICGAERARPCSQCHSAAYCSTECQQTDWRTHKLLCQAYALHAKDNFASRPSKNHYLAIQFPMDKPFPIIGWIETRTDKYTPGHVQPIMDDLLAIPGQTGYVGRGRAMVRGNGMRGRPRNPDTINIWYLDPAFEERGLKTNQTLHGTAPTLVGDTLGETMWEGPIVIYAKEGDAYDPKLVKDVTLTDYRDAIDYLGYFEETYGSMIEGALEQSHFCKLIWDEKVGKTVGVRLNCLRDQATSSAAEAVDVPVPKAHPLFNLEGDDPLAIPQHLGFQWVAKAYCPGETDAAELHNPLAQFLLRRLSRKGDAWQGLDEHWSDPAIGSVLIVDRFRRPLTKESVYAVACLIRDVAVPMMTEDLAKADGGERLNIAAVVHEAVARKIISGPPAF